MNRYLSNHLVPYGLNDLLVGLSCLKGTDGAALVPRFEVGTPGTETERLDAYCQASVFSFASSWCK